ncbi:hypothetical protein [Psychrobacter sanguinis]|uniref:hypothetical protein n=1 Tax=Psychrobacter sanguinis TaxID=861445 RepID=UPI0019191498|nr:hypothetical protein [Psychrobacter sanguinis]MCC3344851.1 hypothetical protein [Psychrobacter sanguinis]
MNKLIAGVLLAMVMTGCDSQEQQLTAIHAKVADDAVEQYDIAKKQGDKVQICAQAGIVSAAYMQAKDEPKYNEWKAVEKADCKAAGITQ